MKCDTYSTHLLKATHHIWSYCTSGISPLFQARCCSESNSKCGNFPCTLPNFEACKPATFSAEEAEPVNSVYLSADWSGTQVALTALSCSYLALLACFSPRVFVWLSLCKFHSQLLIFLNCLVYLAADWSDAQASFCFLFFVCFVLLVLFVCLVFTCVSDRRLDRCTRLLILFPHIDVWGFCF